LNLDGKGEAEINTGIPFFDHMLDQLSRHGNLDLKISAKGDLQIDEHHTIEDVGITLGEAFLKATRRKTWNRTLRILFANGRLSGTSGNRFRWKSVDGLGSGIQTRKNW